MLYRISVVAAPFVVRCIRSLSEPIDLYIQELEIYESTHELANPYEAKAQRLVGFNHVLLPLLRLFRALYAWKTGEHAARTVMMAIPSLMVFLSVALPARYNRILNIVVGALFTLLMASITYSSEWYFYKLFAGIEAVLTALVVWYAWKWPRGVSAA